MHNLRIAVNTLQFYIMDWCWICQSGSDSSWARAGEYNSGCLTINAPSLTLSVSKVGPICLYRRWWVQIHTHRFRATPWIQQLGSLWLLTIGMRAFIRKQYHRSLSGGTLDSHKMHFPKQETYSKPCICGVWGSLHWIHYETMISIQQLVRGPRAKVTGPN